MRPGFPGVPRFPGPWNMHSGYGNGGYGGQHNNGYHNHNGFGNDHWNDYGGFGYPMEVSSRISDKLRNKICQF